MNNTNRNLRGGFAVAWISVLLVIFGIGSMSFFYAGAVLSNSNNSDQGLPMIVLSVLLSVAAVGAAALLTRKRYGFWFIAASLMLISALQVLVAFRIDILLLSVVIVAVLWWLLQPVWQKLD